MTRLLQRAAACFTLAVIAIFALLAGPVVAAPRDDAKSAELAWLAVVDSHQYPQSWTGASSMFRSKITQEKWSAAVKSVRDPLGAVKSRSVAKVTLTKSLPGVPDGDYALIRFQTVFAHKAQALETMTLILEDGKWKAVGYFVR